MQILSGASFHPNRYALFNSSSKLMQILSGASFRPNTYSLFNSYSKLMQILSGASFYPNIYSLFNSYSKLMLILSGASFHPNTYPLFNSYSKLMPTPIHISYSVLIQNLCKSSLDSLFNSFFKTDAIQLWSLFPPRYIFLIQFFFQN